MIVAVLPSFPSLTLVVDSEPSGFLTVIECVPSPLSVTFTTGDLPSAPLAPFSPLSPFSPFSPSRTVARGFVGSNGCPGFAGSST